MLGENLSLLVQVLDDVRDVYGKPRSPDLESGKMTYPLACFLERASAEQRAALRLAQASACPASLREIRALFYDTGALRQVASRMEGFRRAIHAEVARSARKRALMRCCCTSSITWSPACTRHSPSLRPRSSARAKSGWHAYVQRLARANSRTFGGFGAPAPPPLVPWHLPHWMYDKARGVIFYPDIEGLPEETLPFQAALLGDAILPR